MSKEESSKLSPWKKEALQWAGIVLVAVALYATGWHTEVIGRLQSVLLYTGLFQPSVEEPPPSGYIMADYRLSMEDLNGNKHRLMEFKGETIFLNIWATWCPPCIAEMPNIQKLYRDIDPDKVHFVMLSVDEDPKKAHEFIKRKGFDFPVYTLAGGLPPSFQSPVVPTTFVIAPNGNIVMKHEGMASYNTEEFRAYLLKVSEQ